MRFELCAREADVARRVALFSRLEDAVAVALMLDFGPLVESMGVYLKPKGEHLAACLMTITANTRKDLPMLVGMARVTLERVAEERKQREVAS